MPLNWSIENVKNYKSLYRKLKQGEFGYSETEEYKKLKEIPEAIIFYTMTIGMREITDKNWEQFYNRINVWEKINGTRYYRRKGKKLEPLFITKEDVQRMIGLKTNASTKSPTQFKKDLFFNKNI